MKITLPLFNRAVSGILPNVGTFTNTPHGAVLRRTRTSQPAPTPTTTALRWRFAVEVHRYTSHLTDSRQAMPATLAYRLPSLNLSAPPVQPYPLHIRSTGNAYNLGAFAFNRTVIGAAQS